MSDIKLKFNPNLDYQNDAINSVIKLFEGQEQMTGKFTISGQTTFDNSNLGIANKMDLSFSHILKNLNKIQDENGLIPSKMSSLDFNIEMETGTGKTYVFLKTIFELNKNYGFTKFIIVVPTIAIKEGVYKNLEITEEHFKSLYGNKPYNYFVYDSSDLNQVSNFARSSNIEIMIINIDAFNKMKYSESKIKKEKFNNLIYREQDRLNGYKPIEYIQETHPIVIIDEPQTTASSDNAKKSIEELNPLFTLRYSATHKEIQNLIYELNSVDAYEKNLVKQIEIAGFELINDNNSAYIKLKSIKNKNNKIGAKIEIDAEHDNNIKRESFNVKVGDDLSSIKLSNRKLYEGYIVSEICCEKGNEYITFSNGKKLTLNNAIGDIDDIEYKKAQIRKTIEEHLNKQLRLKDKGVKVLSLFFIDKVANYRQYDTNGNEIKGIYAEMFEEAYDEIKNYPEYSKLNLKAPATDVHKGYFSIDKNNKLKNSASEKAFNLIMRNKEQLLSFDCDTSFIFSHSLLKEGWDNPNVFQICTLNETKSPMKKRQEIGRGLRLCVNQKGERIKDRNINILTIIANDYYKNFAENLQKEIEKEEGIKFNILEKNSFSSIKIEEDNEYNKTIGNEKSENIYNYLKKEGYINNNGKILKKLYNHIENNSFKLPEEFKSIEKNVIKEIKKHTNYKAPKNAYKKVKVKLNKNIYSSNDFNKFWDLIKYKTFYFVDFNRDEIIHNCVNALNDELKVESPKLLYHKDNVEINNKGVEQKEKLTSTMKYDSKGKIKQIDIITSLQNEIPLTRNTIVDILLKSKTIELFKKNPQDYKNKVSKIIKRETNKLMIQNIKYNETGKCFNKEIFDDENLYGYLDDNITESNKSLYNYILCDSAIEKEFAEHLDRDDEIELFFKFPKKYTIDTPVGKYNPDWAILVNKDGEKKYFIVETKGDNDIHNARLSERQKAECGKRHFKALGNQIQYETLKDYVEFKKKT